jgi:hypothetical protein
VLRIIHNAVSSSPSILKSPPIDRAEQFVESSPTTELSERFIGQTRENEYAIVVLRVSQVRSSPFAAIYVLTYFPIL